MLLEIELLNDINLEWRYLDCIGGGAIFVISNLAWGGSGLILLRGLRDVGTVTGLDNLGS